MIVALPFVQRCSSGSVAGGNSGRRTPLGRLSGRRSRMPDSFLACLSPDRSRMGSVDVWPMARLQPLECREKPTQRPPSGQRAEVSSWGL